LRRSAGLAFSGSAGSPASARASSPPAAIATGGELVGEVFGAFFGGPEFLLQLGPFVGAEGGSTELDEFLILFPSVGGAADGGAGRSDDQVGFGGFHGCGVDARDAGEVTGQ